MPFLLGVNHVAFGEDRAAPCDARGAACMGHQVAHLFHRIPHAQRLLVEERSGARGALAAAVVVDDGWAIQTQVLRAFAADFKDGHRLRMEFGDHAGDGFEFVFEIQTQDFGDGAAARSGDADAFDGRFGYDVVELLQKVVGGLDGAAGDAAIAGKDQGRIGTDHPEFRSMGAERLQDAAIRGTAYGGQFQADGADVQTDINAHSFAVPSHDRRPAPAIQYLRSE